MATLTYCKRLRMQIDLNWLDPEPTLPLGFVWVPWADEVLPAHAEVMWRSFRGEYDVRVFPNFARREGCCHLLRAIRDLPGFVPEATWLIEAPGGCCGTVQGSREGRGLGMIQNVGVIEDFRGQGLGRALMLKALHGFRRRGLRRAYLDVSVRNRRAVRLYHQLGFTLRKTLYRELTAPDDAYVI